MDPATIGALLVGVGAVVGGLTTFLGKRGENAITGFTSLTQGLQKERDGLRTERDELRVKLLAEQEARLQDQVEIARLTRLVIQLGGEPL